jgi:tetratricopeptide (TPR) repeat protein
MEQPKSTFDHYERGRVLKKNQMFDQALDEFQQAATDPQYAGKAHVQMALCLRATERGEAAVAAFRHALELATFSSKENAHILYLMGQTLETLGRYAEALEAYGWARNEDPGFQDVAHRIKHLISGGRGPLPQCQPPSQAWIGDILKLWGQLRPQLVSLLGQTWESLARYAGSLETYRWVRRRCPSFRDVACRIGHRGLMPNRRSSLESTGRPVLVRRGKTDKRQHVRVAVRLQSHFSTKGRLVAGDGELRDLSPGGCRVTSPVAVPVGEEVECCIFSQDAVNPFTIEGATVRWTRPQEFGLAFTKIRPGVQHQIVQLCRKRMPLS